MESVERWRVVPGYPHYLVSNLGNVDALIAFVPCKGSKGARRMVLGEEVRHRCKPFESVGRKRFATSYQRVYLWRLEGDDVRTKVQMMVHRLVLAAFVGPCPEGYEASHLNGKRDDNRLVNLAWETATQNYKRRVEHRTSLHGERHWAAQLTDAQALTIRQRIANGERQKHLAHEFGVSKYVVNSIARSRSWAESPLVKPLASNVRGEGHYGARLTNEQARQVRQRLARGEARKALAIEFGVGKHVIHQIAQGRSYRDVGVPAGY